MKGYLEGIMRELSFMKAVRDAYITYRKNWKILLSVSVISTLVSFIPIVIMLNSWRVQNPP